MKALKTLKVAVISLLLFFTTTASAQNSILNGDNYIIDDRLKIKINEIGNELKTKTNVNVHIYIKNSLGLSKDMPMREKFKIIKKQESNLIKTVKKPYAILVLSLEDKHSNLLMSKDIEKFLDKDEILDDYVIPLLASKDKNQLYSKASAAVLNGYGQITDVIAKKHGIELESSIGSLGKVTSSIWKVFMYTLVISGLLLYIYAIMKRRK